MLKKVVLCLGIIVSIVIAICEYLLLLIYWGGDGVFAFFAVPIVYTLFLLIQLLIYIKHKMNVRTKKILKYSMIFLTPLLTICIINVFAMVFGINISIM